MNKSASTERPLTLSLSLKGRGDAVLGSHQIDDPARRPKTVLKADAAASPLPAEGEGQGEGRAKSALDGQISTPLETHTYHLRVYFEDTDAGGMVYYANYLKFAERARTEMMREAGVAHAEMIARDGLMLVVRRCTADYLKSARLDDELAIETRVVDIGGASVELDQRIRRGTELLVTLKVLIACINTAGRAARLPDYMRNAMWRDHRLTLK
jgi:acyl-CoA thioester hydrolase